MLIKIKNEEYYNIQRSTGVYMLKCLANDKSYIGSTKQSFRARFSNHCKFLKNNNLGNKELQEDYNLYGPDKFEFIILTECSEELTTVYEQKFINELKPKYNKIKAVNNSKTNLGKKFSEEHKDKIRKKSMLYKHSTKTIELITNNNKENASIYEVLNLETLEKHIFNLKQIKEFFKTSGFNKSINKVYKKKWKITLIKKQSKTVKLLVEGVVMTFESYEKCDKFLNKWRGYTSTQLLKNKTHLDKYKVM